jgi:predicted RNA binding protein YcfA (HicA-like mRNA interferase family)
VNEDDLMPPLVAAPCFVEADVSLKRMVRLAASVIDDAVTVRQRENHQALVVGSTGQASVTTDGETTTAWFSRPQHADGVNRRLWPDLFQPQLWATLNVRAGGSVVFVIGVGTDAWRDRIYPLLVNPGAATNALTLSQTLLGKEADRSGAGRVADSLRRQGVLAVVVMASSSDFADGPHHPAVSTVGSPIRFIDHVLPWPKRRRSGWAAFAATHPEGSFTLIGQGDRGEAPTKTQAIAIRDSIAALQPPAPNLADIGKLLTGMTPAAMSDGPAGPDPAAENQRLSSELEQARHALAGAERQLADERRRNATLTRELDRAAHDGEPDGLPADEDRLVPMLASPSESERPNPPERPFVQPAEITGARLANLRRALPGDIRDVLDEFRASGWVVARISGSSHPVLVAPDGAHTTLSSTPSDRRAATQARAELKRWQRTTAPPRPNAGDD